MEAKWSQNGAKKASTNQWFFGSVFGPLWKHRRDCDGAAGVAATVTLSPADPPGRRHIIKDYCTIISKDGWLAGSNTPRAVGPAIFLKMFQNFEK